MARPLASDGGPTAGRSHLIATPTNRANQREPEQPKQRPGPALLGRAAAALVFAAASEGVERIALIGFQLDSPR